MNHLEVFQRETITMSQGLNLCPSLYDCRLTYFQPSVVLQHSQNISATACKPVSNTLSSAGPQPTLTLKKKSYNTIYNIITYRYNISSLNHSASADI